MRELTLFYILFFYFFFIYYHIDRVGNGVGEIVRGFRANYRELVELCGHKKPRHNGRGVLGMVVAILPFDASYPFHGPASRASD
jgi:hypothetical protein